MKTNTTSKLGLLVVLLASLVVSCQDPDTTSSSSAAVTVAIPSLISSAAPNNVTPQRALGEVPLQVSRVVIAIAVGDQEVTSGDIYASGGSLTLEVPTDVELTVNGTAYAGETITHRGGTTVPALRPGQKASVSFVMAVVAGLGPVTITGPTRIDVTLTGQVGNGLSNRAQFSTDKTRVAFVSASTNLARNDTNGFKDLFVKNLTNGDLRNVHTDSQGQVANSAVTAARGVSEFRVSGDGSTVYFVSDADNLIPGDDNAQPDIFAKNIDSGEIKRVFALPAKLAAGATDPATELEGNILGMDLSEDARRLVFASGNQNTSSDGRGVYLLETTSGNLRFIGAGVRPVISANGLILAWTNVEIHQVSGLSRDVLYRHSLETETRATAFSGPLPVNSTRTFIDGATLSGDGASLVYSLLSVSTDRELGTATYESDGPFRFRYVDEGEITRVGADASGAALPKTKVEQDLSTITPPADGFAGPILPALASFDFELSRRDASVSTDAAFVTFSDGKNLLVKDTRDGRLSALSQAGINPSLSSDAAFVAYTTVDGALFVEPNPLLAAPSAAPNAPASPSANRDSGRAVLTWDAVPNATGYNVYMATSPELTVSNYGNFGGRKFSNVTSPHTVDELDFAKTYYFLITAINAVGESSPSSLLRLDGTNATPLPAPAEPEFADSDALELIWPPVEGALSYNLYIANDDSLTKDNFDRLAGTQVVNVSSPYRITGLPDRAHDWFFVITAVNEAGESASSPPAVLNAQAPRVLPAPVVGAIDSRGMTSISWAPDNSAISYNLYVANDATLTKDNFAVIGGGQRIANVSSPFAFGPVDTTKDYYFIVTGVNLAGESPSGPAAKLAATSLPNVGTAGPSYKGQASTCFTGSFGTVTFSGAVPAGAGSSLSIFCAGSSETSGLLLAGGWGSSQGGADPDVVVWVGVDATSGAINAAIVGFFTGSAATNSAAIKELFGCDPSACGTVQIDRGRQTVVFNNTQLRLSVRGTTPVLDGPILTLNGSFRFINGAP